MKGLKKLVASMLIIMFIYAPIITIFSNESIAANLTGEEATIKLAGEANKIGSYFTYRKDGNRSLDLFCAQKGTSIDSWVNYNYKEAKWDYSAGIFKDETSYQKITWIKDNFWEESNATSAKKYTDEEKLKILKTVDSSMADSDVNAVFNNKNEKFKLYQSLVWEYTKGNYYTVNLSGSTKKVYDAIKKLADNNYKNTATKDIKIQAEDIVYNESSKNYTWKVSITNTYLLPYKMILKVDNNETTDYSYDNGVITISNLDETKDHTFYIKVETYGVITSGENSQASVWLNDNKQNMVELKTERIDDWDDVSKKITKVEPEGYYTLQIKKLEEDNTTPIPGIAFKLSDSDVEYPTDNNGIAHIINEDNKSEITKENEIYSYTIEEIKTTDGDYVGLKDEVTINLKSGTRINEDGVVVYCINQAYFSNNKNEIEVELTNGKTATIKLGIEDSGNTSKVVLTIPNKDKIFDLALTKTIVYPDEEIIEKYDYNYDGEFNIIDTTYIPVISARAAAGGSTLDAIKEVMTEYGLWEHYENYTDDELFDKFDINDDGEVNVVDKALILGLPSQLGVGRDVDRIQYIISKNINKEDITTATYRMDKTTKQIQKDDIITYRINVYNEGDYNANEIQIKDYLPEGLVVCDSEGNTTLDANNQIVCKHNDSDYIWTVEGNVAITTISDTIAAYDGKELDTKYVYIKCKVAETVEIGTVLYNVAEITSAQAVDSEGTVIGIQEETINDRDSQKDTIKDLQNVVDEYKQNFEELSENSDEDMYNIDKSIYDYQDDDDFERIILVPDHIFDLSLRKSITKVGTDASNMEEITERLPVIDETSSEFCNSTGTGLYFHPKEAIQVSVGDYIEYTIRIYNEGAKGDCRGYAKEITDYLPAGLEFYAIVNEDGEWITSEGYKTDINEYGGYEATYDKENNKVVITCVDTPALNVTNKLRTIYKQYEADKVIESYYNVPETSSDDNIYGYQEVKLICKVTNNAESIYLTNLAEITKSIAIANGVIDESVIDIDSVVKNVEMVETATDTADNKVNLKDYYEFLEVNDEYNTYYPGIEDDDDFETVKVKLEGKYNLEIKKVGIDEDGNLTSETIKGATFTVLDGNDNTLLDESNPTDETGLVTIAKDVAITEEGTDIYKITEIKTADGYKPFKTFGLELVVDKKINEYETGYTITNNSYVTPKYLEDWSNVVIATDSSTMSNEEIKELELISKSTVTINEQTQTITITIPNEPIGEFDLALRKYITKVDDTEYTNRVPKFEIKDGKYTYNHTKDPVSVCTSNIVTYTIRVYNEGSETGYASKIMDDIPEGLKFVPATYDDEGKPSNTNGKYGWVPYKEATKDDEINELNSITYNGKTYIITDKAEEAELIITDYLSQDEERTEGENLLLPFDETTMDEPYSKTVEVEFEVTEPNTSDRVIINSAQITEDKDENSNDVEDKDSTPNEWIETDDDQDIEQIKVKYFDLELRKWVTQAIVIENGKETVTETGHKAEDNPEKTVLVEIGNKKINDVTVKFKYSIRVTNKGEIPGYATEISDYIPEGLKFVQEDNPEWKEVEGKIVTEQLNNTLLNPDESAEVELVLTWINGKNNMGEKINTAEISKDYNKYGTPDIDSTPNNKVPNEDDIDVAPVQLSIKTGEVVTYAGLAIAVLTILAGGIISIKKFVLV